MVMKTLICNIPSDRLQNKYIKEYLEEYEYLEADLNPAERVPEKNPSASFLISMAATDPLKFESVITF